MDNILFRCSRVGDLMGKKGMGKTGETFCKDMFLQNTYGFYEEVSTDQMTKGHLCEAESRVLIADVLGGEFRKRNTEKKQNDFVIGTCDIALDDEDYIEDVKNSFTLKTFMNADLKNLYYWQGQAYMWLWNKQNYRLIYTLNPTPFDIIESEKLRWFYKFQCDESNDDYRRICAQIEHNNDLILKIPAKNRMKVFEFKRDETDLELMKERIIKAREFYKTITL